MTKTPTRYCDLVMKGGITSGIVYPNAVLELAKDFRFKNIGGTSAGAIAAAACAAAALGDRKRVGAGDAVHPETLGFPGLEGVARQLSTQGFIYGLFQPAPGAAGAYRTVVILAGRNGLIRKLWVAFAGVVAIAPVEFIVIAGLLLLLAFWVGGRAGLAGALLPTLACAYLGGAIFAVCRVARVARVNLLGLCSGVARRDGIADRWRGALPQALRRTPKPALTEWLHGVLQSLSGKAESDPLVFDDLWSAPRYPEEPATDQAIRLQMITTGVSHHEPRTLPFVDANFWFLREEFDRLFPRSVVDWMVAQSAAPDRVGEKDYYKLPTQGRMPVLVAMRMSLSFPLLISAVPLHEPSAGSRPNGAVVSPNPAARSTSPREERSLIQSTDSLSSGGRAAPSTISAFRVCWFSDGGISSNFPIHLFDVALPQWPTFAMDLTYQAASEGLRTPKSSTTLTPKQIAEAAVDLPKGNNVGWQRSYTSIAQPLALAEVAGFLFGIIATMQNWRDLLQARAPGQRDRIVHVSLDRTEGGMNLDMPQAVLDSISLKGAAAGRALYKFSFDNHYWIRWRNTAAALQRYTMQIAKSELSEPKIAAYRSAFSTAKTGSPAPVSYPFGSMETRKAAEALLGQLVTNGEEWQDLGPDLTKGAPRPLPQLQISLTY